MSYLKIGNNDYSSYVSELKVTNQHKYYAQDNAAGDTVVDYVNSKRQIDLEIIAVNDTVMSNLLADLDQFEVSLSFLNPKTKTLETNVDCIIPENAVEYYMITQGKTLFKKFNIRLIEL